MVTIYIQDKIYVPRKLVDKADVVTHYEKQIFQQATCDKCKVFKEGERTCSEFANDICLQCAAYNGTYKLWKPQKADGKRYYALPNGNPEKVFELLKIDTNKHKVRDERTFVPFKHKIKFTGTLRHGQVVDGAKSANQVRIAQDFLDNGGNGFLVAPPRVGKTVLGTNIACRLGGRTLVIAQEAELLKQFRVAVYENTNVKALEEKTGKKIIVIAHKDEDFKRADIVLTTYQKFITKKGQKRLRKLINGKFSTIIIDEAHLANAFEYSKFVANCDAKYKVALTATFERKDGAHVVAKEIIGPIIAKGKAQMLIPDVKVHDTKIKPVREWKGMTAYVRLASFLAEHKDRNKMLVKQVFADLRANPKHVIIIPCLRVNQVKKLADMINKQAGFNNEFKKENWDDKLAVAYHANTDRDKVLSSVRKGTKTRVIVAIIKMCKLGLNIPSLTHMYLQHPMNNAPDFFQLSQRICTPAPNKPKPMLRMYVDDVGLSKGCFTATWWHGPVKLKMDIDPVERDKAMLIMQSNKRSFDNKRNNKFSGAAGGYTPHGSVGATSRVRTAGGSSW